MRRDAIDSVAATWQRRAARHNAFYSKFCPQAREEWRRLYRHALHALLGSNGERLRILDVGVGTGFVSTLLAESGHDVTGVDVSRRMLGFAQQEARRRGVALQLRLQGADDVPALGDRFDVVTARYVLWTLPRPSSALDGWRRVLRPDGAVLVADAVWRSWEVCWEQACRSLHPGGDRSYLVRLTHDYLSMGRRLPYWRGLSADDAGALLGAAGFSGPERFDQLLGADARPAGADFFVVGARNSVRDHAAARRTR